MNEIQIIDRTYSDTEPLFNDVKILNIFKINDYLTGLCMYRCKTVLMIYLTFLMTIL
jgi:hypothetical protein